MTSCSLYRQHHWRFACKLQSDNVENHKVRSQIGEQTIEREAVIVRDNYSFKLLFYCPCGKLKIIEGNGDTLNNQETIPDF